MIQAVMCSELLLSFSTVTECCRFCKDSNDKHGNIHRRAGASFQWLELLDNLLQRPERQKLHFLTFLKRLNVQELLPVVHQRGRNGSGAAHLLHVGRQQRPGGQEHLLFVHHFSLTGPIVVGAWKKKRTQTIIGGLRHCSCTVGCMEPKKTTQ